MDTAQPGGYEVADLVGCLQQEGALLAEAAEAAGFAAPVPACPGWQVRDLLKHLGYVHRWAAGYVRDQHTRWVDRLSEEEILSGGPSDDVLAGWFRQGHAELGRVLSAAGPETACWTFLDAPSPVAFWARRQAHETAIHRADAQQAAAAAGGAQFADPPDFGPHFATDGIDELIMGFLARAAKRGSWDGPPAVLGLHAEDGTGGTAHWRVDSAPGRLAVARGTGAASCDVTGPAARLYLRLWNRADDSGLDVRGDASQLTAFLEHFHVTWS
ncbi:MAG TPA: maleylpyruvate isomerase family mycothiol-dependent enzyme [Streptosporangiaceae bacterium]